MGDGGGLLSIVRGTFGIITKRERKKVKTHKGKGGVCKVFGRTMLSFIHS